MFIIIFESEFCWPLGWDTSCEGALQCFTDSVAVFPDRKSAKQAIRISASYAKLCKAQGKPHNTDFIEDIKKLKIVPLKTQKFTTTW